MSNQVARIEPSNLSVVPPSAVVSADDWNQERIEFIRRTYCGGAPDSIADTFLQLCRRRHLAPEEKQVYLVKRGDEWNIQTGIDGYRLIADRTGTYAGSDEPEFAEGADGRPIKATVTVWKIVDGVRCPFSASARWTEYYPGDKQGFMWRKMPFLMLSKCAESLALRKAFPAELSGIYTNEEMAQAGTEGNPAGGGRVTESTGTQVDNWNAFWPLAKKLGVKTADDFGQTVGQPLKSFGADVQAAYNALVKAQGGAGTQPAPDPQPDDVIEVDGLQVDPDSGEIVPPETETDPAPEKTAKKPVAEFGKPAPGADRYTGA